MFNKIYLFIAIVWIMILVWSAIVITNGYEAVDYDLVRQSFQTLHDHTDLPEMMRECSIEKVYWNWSDGLYVNIQQDCDKTIIVDVLTEFPTYERIRTKDVPFTNSMS